MAEKIPLDFIKQIPKAELHCHLDGSIRIETIKSLAKQQNIELPSYDSLENIVYQERFKNLEDYLKVFDIFMAILKTPASLEQVAYELVQTCVQDGVFYLETRFAPQIHIGKQIKTIEEAFLAVNNGLKKGMEEYNNSSAVLTGKTPPFKYGIIAIIMRKICKGISGYYDSLLDLYEFTGEKEATLHAGQEVLLASLKAIEKYKLPIVSIDIAGSEVGGPAEYFKDIYDQAKANFLNLTAHAGESVDVESIYNAVIHLNCQRIGHGLHLFDHEICKRDNPESFCKNVADYMLKKKVGIEVCLTSNYQTCQGLKDLSNHPFKKMLEYGLKVCLCSDNLTPSNTVISKEVNLAVKTFNLTPKELKEVILNSFDQCFYNGTQKEKQEYIEKIKKYYQEIELKYHISN